MANQNWNKQNIMNISTLNFDHWPWTLFSLDLVGYFSTPWKRIELQIESYKRFFILGTWKFLPLMLQVISLIKKYISLQNSTSTGIRVWLCHKRFFLSKSTFSTKIKKIFNKICRNNNNSSTHDALISWGYNQSSSAEHWKWNSISLQKYCEYFCFLQMTLDCWW